MNKRDFLDQLRSRLEGLPAKDVEERIEFYAEIIEDRIEEGLSEEEAVMAIGSVDGIAGQIASDIPLAKIAKEKIRSKGRLRPWEIVLLVLGVPLWIVLLAATFVIALSLYAVLWSLVVSLWAVFGALAGCGLGLTVGGSIFAVYVSAFEGLALIAAGLVSAGLAVFLFLGCLPATKGTVILTKKSVGWIKKCLIRKEKSK